MKRILYLLLLFFFALSCKDIDETPVSGALGVNNDILTFYSAGGYEILNIKNSTGSVWTITKPEDASWCTVDRISGSASSVPVTVAVAKNDCEFSKYTSKISVYLFIFCIFYEID